MGESDAIHVDRAELLDLYRVAIDEYRFQVQLNWSRTQYYLALNVGILAAATGLLHVAGSTVGGLVAGIYCAGAVCCGLSIAAAQVQRGYYRAARDHKAAIEDHLELGSLKLRTTPGMGSAMRRLGKVTTFNAVTLTVLAAIDVAGVVVSVAKTW